MWEEEFAEVFEQGGFDVVIGNPPYGVQQNKLIRIMREYFWNRHSNILVSEMDLYEIFLYQNISNKLKKDGLIRIYYAKLSWLY